jgi:hypothetical protein
MSFERAIQNKLVGCTSKSQMRHSQQGSDGVVQYPRIKAGFSKVKQ